MTQEPRQPKQKKNLTGNPRLALETALRAAKGSPAYASFLEERGLLEKFLGGGLAFGDLPLTDKDSYCLGRSPASLLPDGAGKDVNGFFSSSGSSGAPFSWPRLKTPPHSLSLPDWMEETFAISRKKTLAVAALNMDGWTAGMNTALALNQFSLEAPFPFMAAFPGGDYRKALRIIAGAAELAEQVIVFIYPVAIPYFLDLAKKLEPSIPFHKLRFASTGDPFTEEFREHLDGVCGASWPETALASYSYSSADTRVIGTENRASRALSRLLLHDEKLRGAFGLGEELPNLFITVPPEEMQLTEEIEGELVFTRWQAVPLVRYNLHDKGEIWDWERSRRLVEAASPPAELRPLQEEFAAIKTAPGDIVALYGRSKALYFYGMYADEASLRRVVASPGLAHFRPGLFTVSKSGDPLSPRLEWEIELGTPAGPDTARKLRGALIAACSEEFPHFGVNYRNFLHEWEGDPEREVFRLRLPAYPELSDRLDGSRKHRIIRDTNAR